MLILKYRIKIKSKGWITVCDKVTIAFYLLVKTHLIGLHLDK